MVHPSTAHHITYACIIEMAVFREPHLYDLSRDVVVTSSRLSNLLYCVSLFALISLLNFKWLYQIVQNGSGPS